MLWFMNHISNPLVRWILQSPLHSLMSKSVLLISFTGKKSGNEYMTPVQYARQGQTIWIMVGAPQQKVWWKNLIGGALVRLCLQGSWQEGQGKAILGSEDPQGVQQGLAQFISSYPQLKQQFDKISANAESIAQTVFVKVDLE